MKVYISISYNSKSLKLILQKLSNSRKLDLNEYNSF